MSMRWTTPSNVSPSVAAPACRGVEHIPGGELSAGGGGDEGVDVGLGDLVVGLVQLALDGGETVAVAVLGDEVDTRDGPSRWPQQHPRIRCGARCCGGYCRRTPWMVSAPIVPGGTETFGRRCLPGQWWPTGGSGGKSSPSTQLQTSVSVSVAIWATVSRSSSPWSRNAAVGVSVSVNTSEAMGLSGARL